MKVIFLADVKGKGKKAKLRGSTNRVCTKLSYQKNLAKRSDCSSGR